MARMIAQSEWPGSMNIDFASAESEQWIRAL
jgi:hypothetical protein